MNVRGLEMAIDRELVKRADSVLGRPETLGGAAVQTGLYLTPGLGSALSVADGINDLYHGRWGSGLGNLALGIGSGVADFFSLGTLGTAMRGASTAARGAKVISGAAKAARAAKGSTMATRGYRAARAFAGTAGKLSAGKAINMAQRGAMNLLGPAGYSRLMQAGHFAANASRNAKAWAQGYRSWAPVAKTVDAVKGFVRQSPAASRALEYGRNALGAYRRLPGYVRQPANLLGGAAAYSLIPGADMYANLRYGGSPLVKLLGAEGTMMIPQNYLDRSNPDFQRGRSEYTPYQQRDFGWDRPMQYSGGGGFTQPYYGGWGSQGDYGSSGKYDIHY